VAAIQGKNAANAPEKSCGKISRLPSSRRWSRWLASGTRWTLCASKMAGHRQPLRQDEAGRAGTRAGTHARVGSHDAGRTAPGAPELRARKLNPTQKSTSWESYQQLTDEQKKELAAKAATKKQVANLPTPTQAKAHTVAPIKPATPSASPGVATPVVPPVVPPADASAPLPNASNVTPVPTGPAPAAPTPQPAPAPAPADVK
jgi:hypothetical protein